MLHVRMQACGHVSKYVCYAGVHTWHFGIVQICGKGILESRQDEIG